VTPSDAHSRDQLRQAYCDAWRKHVAGLPLTPLEAMIADVVSWHPEYQAVVQNVEAARALEINPAQQAENPFLHLGLHIAVREQLSIDRPPGVRHVHQQLKARYGTPHDADHVMMDALAETLWEAQRSGQPPDETQYLDRARTRLRAAGTRDH
jgi:hypothetical protein